MPAVSKDNTNTVSQNAKEKRRSKFLFPGKYFLFALLFAAQAGLAYFLVDKYYDVIYEHTLGNISEEKVTLKIDEIIANPTNTNAQRFLVVEIGLELSSNRDIELIQRHEMQIRDRINEVLSSKQVNELIRYDGRQELRRELAGEINRVIGTHSVRNLYFTKYVMQ